MCSTVIILIQEESALSGKKKPLTCCESTKYYPKHKILILDCIEVAV